MPDKVYVIEGWFGDQEWIEAIYLDKSKAEARSKVLWETRTSSHWPDDHWIQGHCKFQVVEHNLVDAKENEVTWSYRCEVWKDDVQGWSSVGGPSWSNLTNDEAHKLAGELRAAGWRVRIIGDYTS